MTGLGRLAGRAGWNVLDQGVLSLTNLALSVLVARSVDASGFGAFSLCFMVYSITLTCSRNLGSQPLIIRFADAADAEFRDAAARSAGAAVSIGLLVGTGAVVMGLAVGGVAGHCLIALGLVLPGVLVQDAWRLVAIARRRPRTAVSLDVAWGGMQLAAVFLLVATDVAAIPLFVAVWGLTGASAAAIGAGRMRLVPRLRGASAWVRQHFDLTGFTLLEALLLQGAAQGVLLLIGTMGDLETVGALRAAQVVNGPIALLAASAFTFAVPELVNRSALRDQRPVTVALVIGSALAVVGAVWNGLLLLVPDAFGERLLGDSWDGMSAILLVFAIGQVGNLVATGAAVVAYAMGETRTTFSVHCVLAVLLGGRAAGSLARRSRRHCYGIRRRLLGGTAFLVRAPAVAAPRSCSPATRHRGTGVPSPESPGSPVTLISVLVPVLNEESRIAETVASILAQPGPDLEVLVAMAARMTRRRPSSPGSRPATAGCVCSTTRPCRFRPGSTCACSTVGASSWLASTGTPELGADYFRRALTTLSSSRRWPGSAVTASGSAAHRSAGRSHWSSPAVSRSATPSTTIRTVLS